MACFERLCGDAMTDAAKVPEKDFQHIFIDGYEFP